MRSPLIAPLAFWLTVILLVIVGAFALASCATKVLPVCVKYEYRIATDEDGVGYQVLDPGDVAKLHALIMGLSNGTCRLPRPGVQI